MSSPLPMLDIIRDGGLLEAPQFRARVFGYRVSRPALERRTKYGYRPPWGWVWLRDRDQNTWRVGPVWLLAPGVYARWLAFSYCNWALKVGLARELYDGCYYHELVWFPDQPRFQ